MIRLRALAACVALALSLAGLRNDLAFFKEQKLLADPTMMVERVVDTSIAEAAVKELGPYKRRGN